MCVRAWGAMVWPKLTTWVGVPANLCEEQMLDHQRVTSHIQSLWRERPGSARPVGGGKGREKIKILVARKPLLWNHYLSGPGTWPCLHSQEQRARSPSR